MPTVNNGGHLSCARPSARAQDGQLRTGPGFGLAPFAISTIMADTEILGARAQQVRIPVLVGGAVPQLRCRPGRGDDVGVSRLICRFPSTPFDR